MENSVSAAVNVVGDVVILKGKSLVAGCGAGRTYLRRDSLQWWSVGVGAVVEGG